MRLCEYCKKEINLSECYVELSTFNIGNNENREEHTFFHMMCWRQYFERKALEKAKFNLGKIQEQFTNMFINNPQLKDAFSQIEGSEQVIQMATTPLSTKTIIIDKINETKEQKENDGRKKSKRRH